MSNNVYEDELNKQLNRNLCKQVNNIKNVYF